VSTDDKGQNTENQMAPLLAFAERRGWPVVAVYKEEETAWKAGHQAELARAKEDARKGKFDVLLVWALDRLCREGPLGTLQLWHQMLDSYRVQIISLQESWTELGGPMVDLFLSLSGWVAKYESDRRSERTKAGMARVRQYGSKSGLAIGRPKGKKDKTKRRRKVKA